MNYSDILYIYYAGIKRCYFHLSSPKAFSILYYLLKSKMK